MPFPIRTCAVCGEEFELRPNKPGFANRCPTCSETEEDDDSGAARSGMSAEERRAEAEANEHRRKAIRDLLYRKDR